VEAFVHSKEDFLSNVFRFVAVAEHAQADAEHQGLEAFHKDVKRFAPPGETGVNQYPLVFHAEASRPSATPVGVSSGRRSEVVTAKRQRRFHDRIGEAGRIMAVQLLMGNERELDN